MCAAPDRDDCAERDQDARVHRLLRLAHSFENEKVDAEFFPDGKWKSNFLVDIGHGDPRRRGREDDHRILIESDGSLCRTRECAAPSVNATWARERTP